VAGGRTLPGHFWRLPFQWLSTTRPKGYLIICK
jgi:hypothetical protein